MQTNVCIYVSNTFWLILTILCPQRVLGVLQWLKCTVLYCTVLYCTVLYFTVRYCTVLYCTVLSSWMWIVHVWDRVRNSRGPGRAGRADSRSNETLEAKQESTTPSGFIKTLPSVHTLVINTIYLFLTDHRGNCFHETWGSSIELNILLKMLLICSPLS